MRVIGPRAVRLYPIFHPAAALYTPRMLETLRTDFHRLPELLALEPPPQPEPQEPAPPEPEPVVPEPELLEEEDEQEEQQEPAAGREPENAQLGLF